MVCICLCPLKAAQNLIKMSQIQNYFGLESDKLQTQVKKSFILVESWKNFNCFEVIWGCWIWKSYSFFTISSSFLSKHYPYLENILLLDQKKFNKKLYGKKTLKKFFTRLFFVTSNRSLLILNVQKVVFNVEKIYVFKIFLHGLNRGYHVSNPSSYLPSFLCPIFLGIFLHCLYILVESLALFIPDITGNRYYPLVVVAFDMLQNNSYCIIFFFKCCRMTNQYWSIKISDVQKNIFQVSFRIVSKQPPISRRVLCNT